MPGREQGEGSDDRLLSTRPFGLSGWEIVKGSLSHDMVSDRRAQPIVGGTIPGLVVLGSIRKQAE